MKDRIVLLVIGIVILILGFGVVWQTRQIQETASPAITGAIPVASNSAQLQDTIEYWTSLEKNGLTIFSTQSAGIKPTIELKQVSTITPKQSTTSSTLSQ